MSVKRPTAHETVARDNELVKDRAKGTAWAKVAKKHDVSVNTVKRAWERHSAANVPQLGEQDALDVIYETLSRYEAWQGQLAEITDNAKGAVRVGAIRAQMDCETRKTDLRQATGLLPKNLGKLAVEWDIRFVVGKLIQVLDKHDAPAAMQEDLLAVLKRSN